MVKVETVVIGERIEAVIDAAEEQSGHVGVTVVEATGLGRDPEPQRLPARGGGAG